MQKTDAIKLLGGTASEAARLIGITPQAISGWPDELTPALRDRVQAALYRKKREQTQVDQAAIDCEPSNQEVNK